MPKPPRPRQIRVPAFAPVPLRARADGWTPQRQAAFLGALAETGSVSEAARRVGMARETAYRLRRKPGAGSFAHAWDAVMGRAQAGRRKVTAEEFVVRAFHGLLKPVIHCGKHAGTIRKTDNSALLRHLALLDRSGLREEPHGERSQSFAAAPASTSRPGHGAQMQAPEAVAPDLPRRSPSLWR